MTDEERKNYHDSVDDNIKKYGYHTTYVFAGKSPSFCYSTGVYHSFRIPEIFISSLPKNLSQGLIGDYVDKFKNKGSVPINKLITDLNDRFPIYLIEVTTNKLTDYALSSFRFYNDREFKYVQLVFPDTKGHFPNDKGYNYDQIIIGDFNH